MERAFILTVAVSTVFVAWFVSYRSSIAPIEVEEDLRPQSISEPNVEPQLIVRNSAPRTPTKIVPKDRSLKTPIVPKDRSLKITPAAPRTMPAPAPLHWTLPFSCANAKWYSANFTATQLEAMRKSAGMPLPTADQRAQIQACLAGRIK